MTAGGVFGVVGFRPVAGVAAVAFFGPAEAPDLAVFACLDRQSHSGDVCGHDSIVAAICRSVLENHMP